MTRQTKIFKTLVALLCAIIVLSSCQITGPEKETLRVGMECGYSPFNWTQLDDTNGGVKIEGTNQYAGGYDVQIAKLVAKKLGRELVIVKTAWNGLVPGLQSGKIDAIVAGMSATEERKQEIDFSDNYYSSDLVLVIKKDGPFASATSLSDFASAKITGQLGTLHYDVIDQIEGVNKQTALEDFPNMIVALNAGTIDAYVSERPGALGAVFANADLTYIDFAAGEGFIFDTEEVSIGIGIKKGNPLTEEVNAALAEISEESRAEIMQGAVEEQPLDGEISSSDTGFFKAVSLILEKYGAHFLNGALTTLFIAFFGTIFGLLIGLIVASVKTSPLKIDGSRSIGSKIINFILNIYIEVFRGTPMMVQATVFYYGLKQFFNIDISPLMAGLIIVSINTGAYMAEVVRGGIDSIDKGQVEAATAIGMTHGQTMRHVILPQAIRNILPATGNEFVINIKDTSVLNVIAVTELYYASKDVQTTTYQTFETFFITAVIYLILTFTITRILHFIERKMDGPKNFTLTSSTTRATVDLHQKQGEERAYGRHY